MATDAHPWLAATDPTLWPRVSIPSADGQMVSITLRPPAAWTLADSVRFERALAALRRTTEGSLTDEEVVWATQAILSIGLWPPPSPEALSTCPSRVFLAILDAITAQITAAVSPPALIPAG